MKKANRMSSIKKTIKKIYISLVSILPIDNDKAVFCNFTGRGYGDSPKYIAEELHKRAPNMKIIWLCSEKNALFPAYVTRVKLRSLRHYFEINTARIIISNVRVDLGLKKRNRQIYIQTWHAPFSPKKLELEAIDTLTEEYIRDARHDGFITDAILSNSSLLDNQYERVFGLNENAEILRVGLPRNDFLIRNAKNEDICTEIRAKLNISADQYIVLYAPTFRDDYSSEGYKLLFENIRVTFERKMKKECVMLIRLHPNAYKQLNEIIFSKNIINITEYPDMQELAIAADAVISDYSSVVFDFAILGKPSFICALDLQHYIDTRGLLDEFYSFPFPHAYSNEELIDKINTFDADEYSHSLNAYFENNPIYDKGYASEKTVDWILNKITQ